MNDQKIPLLIELIVGTSSYKQVLILWDINTDLTFILNDIRNYRNDNKIIAVTNLITGKHLFKKFTEGISSC